MEFTDLNSDFQPFQRAYTKDIMKIQEIERRVREIESQLKEYNIQFESDITPSILKNRERQTTIDAITAAVNKAYSELKSQVTAEKDLKKQLSERQLCIEAQGDSIRVLQQIDHFLAWRNEAQAALEHRQHQVAHHHVDNAVPLLKVSQGLHVYNVGFKYIAGVVTTAQRVSFERQVFLTSRGNSLVQFEEQRHDRIVFVVFFLGNQLQRSLKRLCQFMNIFVCYESDNDMSREALLKQAVNEKMEDKRAHSATKKLLKELMRETASELQGWKITLLQEKGIRMTLNKFRLKSRNNLLLAEGWCPTQSKEQIHSILETIVRNKGVTSPILTDQPFKGKPPTHFEENELLTAFQAIVDTYGVPRYKEFNPAIPTIVTFPFLFGVMYGDMFHGSCLLLFALSLLVIGKMVDANNSKSETFTSLYHARYVLLFMGAFAVYCGVIYNDCMSIMVNGWNGSQWQHGYTDDGYAVMVQRNVYSVGIDPAWSGVDNQLSFANSLKMKLSVIIGVTQMTFGLLLKLSNHIQEHDYISIFFEFIPQLIFMVCFFGYMVFLIFYKWCIDWTTSNLPDTPSLITVLIKMFLSPGTVDSEVQIFANKDFQALIQVIFLLLLVFSIPAMLCIKPCILRSRMSKQHGHLNGDDEKYGDRTEVQMPTLDVQDYQKMDDASLHHHHSHHEGGAHEMKDMEYEHSKSESHPPQPEASHGHDESFGDIVIHQLIHTIEYVLGTISNTASYLRLWALSLAHAELSEVFFDKTLRTTLESNSIVMNVVSVAAFLMFTCGVLLIMDVLECFLHALRLHWVEFQSKFFYADGQAFRPFSFAKLLEME
ncbi:hypothetical protein RFI_06063 [Reticulomyxa filosa]|uniref:V-type proton ATPase subunit a n=1 Tax=Reticulomyxa filosa TaxID=46433 RepID=X6NYY9_RETFI|nr:hypothetical protein RFI_06063 [Reticulomyxa filosa]|eukprot:ETO31054.1 hypothetical protein RFI_06063 [Reticulomyxa filosa]